MLISSGPEDFLLFIPEIYFPISWTVIKGMVNGKKGRQACKEYGRKKDRQVGRKVEQVEGRKINR